MPTRDQHLALAKKLIKFIETTGGPLEIIVGATYWASLHLIDAILAEGDIHPGSDGERNHFLRQTGENFRQMRHDYEETKHYYEDTLYRAVERTLDDYKLEVLPRFQRLVEKVQDVLGDRYGD